jgi:hypothetical protein
MATVSGVYTTKEQNSIVRLKELSAKDIYKEMLPVYGRKCLSRKAINNWVEKKTPWLQMFRW